MRNLLFALPAGLALVSASMLLSTQEAKAVPDCETQVRIRCMGYSFNGQPPIDGYDSVEECVAAETPLQCPFGLSSTDLDGFVGKAEVTNAAQRALG